MVGSWLTVKRLCTQYPFLEVGIDQTLNQLATAQFGFTESNWNDVTLYLWEYEENSPRRFDTGYRWTGVKGYGKPLMEILPFVESGKLFRMGFTQKACPYMIVIINDEGREFGMTFGELMVPESPFRVYFSAFLRMGFTFSRISRL
jgi:hypothetical protein